MKMMPKQLLLPSHRARGGDDSSPQVADQSIGDLLRQSGNLSDEQIAEIAAYQKARGVRFGEAAVALNLVSADEVVWALSRQFHYPYLPGKSTNLNRELVAATDPFGDQAEAFREMRSQLLMGVLAPNQPRRALAVLSPSKGDGKSFFCANLAIAFSQLGGFTLLVDADMRTPRQQELFGLPRGAGLSNILASRAETDVIYGIPDLPNLYVLPVGTLPPNPLELVQRPEFDLVLLELLAKFDYIIVDTPAAEHGADARVLAAKCGAAMVIGRRGTSRVAALHKLVTQVSKGPANMAGVMINEY